MPLLLLIFVVLPLIEIALFIIVGGAIGLWPTLAVVVGTAIAGSWLLRRQGARTLVDVQQAFDNFRDPAAPLAHGAMIMAAGVLLIAPGLFTDTLGVLLLLPPVRTALLRMAGRRRTVHARTGFTVHPAEPEPHRYGHGIVIDADYVEAEPEAPRPPNDAAQGGPRRPSGWTRGSSSH